MGRVLLTDHAWPDDRLERTVIEAAGHDLVCGPARAGDVTVIEELAERHRPDAIMTCWAPVSANAIAAAGPGLRLVARMGVGLDNIAVDAATRAGAWVTNVPDYCVEEVSDHALALIFAWTRGIAELDASVKAGEWDPARARLRRLATLTAGIVGLGRIGRATARKLHGLGLNVLAADPHAEFDFSARIVNLEELLSAADIVVLHLPLTAQTRHFMNAGTLSQMKPGAFLVNVSRGPLIDNGALLAALNAGHLSGAGLDVVDGEPAPPRELVSRPDVIVTPHVAFSSGDSVAELRTRAAEEVVRVLGGQLPAYPCNNPRVVS